MFSLEFTKFNGSGVFKCQDICPHEATIRCLDTLRIFTRSCLMYVMQCPIALKTTALYNGS